MVTRLIDTLHGQELSVHIYCVNQPIPVMPKLTKEEALRYVLPMHDEGWFCGFTSKLNDILKFPATSGPTRSLGRFVSLVGIDEGIAEIRTLDGQMVYTNKAVQKRYMPGNRLVRDEEIAILLQQGVWEMVSPNTTPAQVYTKEDPAEGWSDAEDVAGSLKIKRTLLGL
ncbi:MAG TPA: hypothetical protein VJB87_04985 [Candidatus Nanoarchaeia archaeon]|nr:hypothetical protein [Candidatus Nanoarchaeia archaeon]